jgi:hypothetical protein
VLGGQHGTVTAVDLRASDPAFAGQRLGQRSLHDVLQPPEPMTVERQLVVLYYWMLAKTKQITCTGHNPNAVSFEDMQALLPAEALAGAA